MWSHVWSKLLGRHKTSANLIASLCMSVKKDNSLVIGWHFIILLQQFIRYQNMLFSRTSLCNVFVFHTPATLYVMPSNKKKPNSAIHYHFFSETTWFRSCYLSLSYTVEKEFLSCNFLSMHYSVLLFYILAIFTIYFHTRSSF